MRVIEEVMLNLTKKINKKCDEQGNNGEDIFFLAAALKEVASARDMLPRDIFDT